MPEQTPEAYEPKEVVKVESDTPGWLFELKCGHII